MSDERRYEIHVSFRSNPPSNPKGAEGALVARALRTIAGNLEHRTDLPTTHTLLGELFDYEHQYGFWSARTVRDGD